jgi:hypothetical protein
MGRSDKCIKSFGWEISRQKTTSDIRHKLFCNLFNDVVSKSDYIALNDCNILNNELERMWQEVAVI